MLTIFNIQRFSLHDGEGVRTNIFFKGCLLRCSWCNNPESLDFSPSIMFDERLCNQFEDCIKVGKGQVEIREGHLIINRHLIEDASLYDNICPSKAISVAGQKKSISQIITEIEKDVPFYNTSGGGVTLTGGEPLAQGDELLQLIHELKKRKIHISAETSLHLPWETIRKLTAEIDVILADLKHVDIEKFARYTGGDATLVMNNFKKLNEAGKNFVVRVPVIPEFNFSNDELKAIIDFVYQLGNAPEIHFIPYHSLAKEKYTMLGLDYTFGNHKNIEKSELIPFIEYAKDKGLTSKILN